VIFACDRCGRRYSVPDERVQGRAFRVTCKSCGNVIVVRPAAAAAAPAAPAVPQAGGGAADLQDPFAAAATAPAAPAPPARPAAPRPASPPPRAASPAPQAPVRAAPPAPGPSAAAPRRNGSPPGPARPPAAVTAVASRSAEDTSRALTTAEMAWMSADASRAAAPAAGPEPEIAITEPAQGPAGRAERKGPGILRIVLAAFILGLAAAAVVAFVVRPALRSKPRPPPRAVVAAPSPPPAVPAPPAATPEPPIVASPQPASATVPAAEPPAAPPAPARQVGPGARFEPGTVKIARVRRREQHRLAGKDRRLLDLLARKHDEAAPPEPVEKLDLDTARSLDPAAVERVLGESQGAFSGCVTRAVKVAGLPDARRATLLLTVAGSGEVSTAWVAEADVSRTRLGKCLVGAARRLVFPAFEGDPVDVSVPLTLEAR